MPTAGLSRACFTTSLTMLPVLSGMLVADHGRSEDPSPGTLPRAQSGGPVTFWRALSARATASRTPGSVASS